MDIRGLYTRPCVLRVQMETFETDSAAATELLGRELAGRFKSGDCVALVGGLGSGKTVLVRGLAVGLGLGDVSLVCSPSYVLVRRYPARITVYHLDLYRIRSGAELADLGLEEMLADGLVLIEWADRAQEYLPRPRWQISIEITGADTRRLMLSRVRQDA